MKASSSIKKADKLERPYLCVGEGAIWLAELEVGFVCVDTLERDHLIGTYEEDLNVDGKYDGAVTLTNS